MLFQARQPRLILKNHRSGLSSRSEDWWAEHASQNDLECHDPPIVPRSLANCLRLSIGINVHFDCTSMLVLFMVYFTLHLQFASWRTTWWPQPSSRSYRRPLSQHHDATGLIWSGQQSHCLAVQCSFQCSYLSSRATIWGKVYIWLEWVWWKFSGSIWCQTDGRLATQSHLGPALNIWAGPLYLLFSSQSSSSSTCFKSFSPHPALEIGPNLKYLDWPPLLYSSFSPSSSLS